MVALDRQSIEKKDFPTGDHGYDAAAVDAHLSALADEVDELKRSSRQRSESVAAAASERVSAIVDAAEASAAEITRQAEADAHEIRNDASVEALATRDRAATEARDYVGKVNESTAGMIERLEAMKGELGALLESLRSGATKLQLDLGQLDTELEKVRHAAVPRRRGDAPTSAPAETASAPAEPAAPAETAAPAEGRDEGAETIPAALEPAPAPQAGDESEGARLVALNMALNGTPRDETEKYLAENFKLSDRGRLLDEVYESVEG
jgi:hypothetical protein